MKSMILPEFQVDIKGELRAAELKAGFPESGGAPFCFGVIGKGVRLGGNAQGILVQFPIIVEILEYGYGVAPVRKAAYLDFSGFHRFYGNGYTRYSFLRLHEMCLAVKNSNMDISARLLQRFEIHNYQAGTFHIG